MSATKPAAGHGVQLGVELDSTPGVPNHGVFTAIIGITNALPISFSREATEVGAHSDSQDVYSVAEYLKRGTVQVEGNYLFGNTAQDAIVTAMLSGATERGWQWVGPPGDTAQILIFSGAIIDLSWETPAKAGVRNLKFTIRPSGPMKHITTIYD